MHISIRYLYVPILALHYSHRVSQAIEAMPGNRQRSMRLRVVGLRSGVASIPLRCLGLEVEVRGVRWGVGRRVEGGRWVAGATRRRKPEELVSRGGLEGAGTCQLSQAGE